MAAPLRPIRRTITHPGRQIQRGLRLLRPTDIAADAPLRDVWYWARQRKYLNWAVSLWFLNIVLFAGLGCFAYWLRTGEFTPFSGRPYTNLFWEAFDPTSVQQITLTDFLLRPIPANDVPLMWIVISLVLASLTAIPILVSMLYRFPFSLPFAAIIGFVAVFPWLAITVTFCCLLARWRPLRFSFRFATGLIAYFPVVIYYAMAVGDKAVSSHLTPLEVARLYLPWILAITFAFLLMAVVLLIAKLVNYRPFAIAPLMTVMFALPVLLFEAKVGRDELYYRLLQTHFERRTEVVHQEPYGAGSEFCFADHFDLDEIARRIASAQAEIGIKPNTPEQIALDIKFRAASAQLQLPELLALLEDDFSTQQHEAVAACQAFRRRYPYSRYIPNTLYLEGQALDTRIDPQVIVVWPDTLTNAGPKQRDTLYIRYYQDFPWRASLPVWKALQEGYPDSPFSTAAALHLAALQAREGHVDAALASLTGMLGRKWDAPEASTQPAGWLDMLARRPASSSIDLDRDGVLLDSRKLLDLLQANRDPQQNDLALRELLGFDPRDAHYRRNLERLLGEIPTRFPLTRLRDNVQVLLARSEPSPSRRIEALKACIDSLARNAESDALPRARFELAVAYQEDKRPPEEARATLEQLQRSYPRSPWAAEASRRLAAMGAAGRVSISP